MIYRGYFMKMHSKYAKVFTSLIIVFGMSFAMSFIKASIKKGFNQKFLFSWAGVDGKLKNNHCNREWKL